MVRKMPPRAFISVRSGNTLEYCDAPAPAHHRWFACAAGRLWAAALLVRPAAPHASPTRRAGPRTTPHPGRPPTQRSSDTRHRAGSITDELGGDRLAAVQDFLKARGLEGESHAINLGLDENGYRWPIILQQCLARPATRQSSPSVPDPYTVTIDFVF